MALKGDRQVLETEIGFYLNEVATRGVVVCVSTAGSGVALDNVSSVATVAANSSGNKPIGILLNDFVNLDLTKFPVNWHKDQANSGDKATILTKGWVVTDQITGTPVARDFAVLSSSGTVATLAPGGTWNEVANPKVGRFITKKDQSGYARVYVDL
jgi:hypothetical protein